MEHENRDMDIASAVAVMAAMGRFDTEFLIYGSAVREADGKNLLLCNCKSRETFSNNAKGSHGRTLFYACRELC